MNDQLRERARERFAGRCAYCGVHEDDVGATLTVDHHRPRACGGDDVIDNLVYACPRCNDHKGAYWHEKDPPYVPLLHPGRDDLAAHVREDDHGRMVALTPEGQFFVGRLRLNRPQLIAYRSGRLARRKLREELATMMDHVRALEQKVNELGMAIDAAADDIEGDGR